MDGPRAKTSLDGSEKVTNSLNSAFSSGLGLLNALEQKSSHFSV